MLAAGGPIAILRNGDIIDIAITNRKLDVRLTETEIGRRFNNWRPVPPKIQTGYLSRYSRMVSSADKGAVVS